MQRFNWAANNLAVATPPELQARGVGVFPAPNIAPGTRVVNLANGSVMQFEAEEERPRTGYFADDAELARYCRVHGLPLTETNGQVSALPVGFDQAGDPLQHRGS